MGYKFKDFELGLIWKSYHNEIVHLRKKASSVKSTKENRAMLRAFFSMVEGITYRIRQVLLHRYELKEIQLTPVQFIVLSEKEVQLNFKGIITSKVKYRSFESMFNFTLNLYSSLYGNSEIFSNAKELHDYQDFIKCQKIRNLVTHPKNSKDLNVSGKDYSLLESAHTWFHKLIIDLLKGDMLIE